MPLLIGVALALGTVTFARLTRLDRDRAFYAAVLITVATYYILFAAMSGDGAVILAESLLAAGFVAAAAIGYRGHPWIVPVAIAAHGLLDGVHHLVVDNPSVPSWWPAFCLAFDVAAGALLCWQLVRSRKPAQPHVAIR